MDDSDFNAVVEIICKEDPRYDRRAYGFIRDGLDHTVKEQRAKDRETPKRSRHVSGAELLQGMRAYALGQFGPLSKTVLNAWGIRRCADFGELVFNLIEHNVFSKTETDRREDFSELYDFEDAFVRPFQPRTPLPAGPTGGGVCKTG